MSTGCRRGSAERPTRVIGISLATIATALAATSCGGDGGGFINPPAVVITMTPGTASLNVGGSTTFNVSITGGSPTPTLASCSSSDLSVATAAVSGSSCTATGVSAGQANILASSSGGHTTSVRVTVAALPAALTAFTLTPPTASVTVGNTVALTATPTGAQGATVTVTYQSAASGVASVSTSGVVTGVSAGTAVITATAQASGSGLAPTTLTQTSTITVGVNPCAPVVVTLPLTRTGSITSSSCAITSDVQRRGDILRINLASATALEVRITPTGFPAYLAAYPANDAEFVFATGNPSLELRRIWHLPSGTTELKVGTMGAGQSGAYTVTATSVSANVTGCLPVVIGGSLESTQALSTSDCNYGGRAADEYLVFSSRPCVITMTRASVASVSNPALQVYAGSQLVASDNGSIGLSGARVSLPSCRSQANDVLAIRATSTGLNDFGQYTFTVTFNN